MRAGLALLILVAAAGCGEQRSFNEQFDDTERELRNKSQRLDQQLSTNDADEIDAIPEGTRASPREDVPQ
ncbi:hypothetical protein ACFQPG_00820 [Sphingomonas sp. GCM10030256]|uniref:hypothetical protein n=1 Tax=Sphingomonas sp. GCM10030256 TaxID=3273427 RepID=UPI00361ABD44